MIITMQYIWVFIGVIILIGISLFTDSLKFTDRFSKGGPKLFRSIILLLLAVGIIWLCFISFPLTLFLAVIVTGLIALIDLLFFRRKRKQKTEKQPLAVEYARSFFWVLLIVWVIRSFVVQMYRVPTGSLEPTILPGDFILVNQHDYGLRLWAFRKKLIDVGKPKIGDIALFHWPKDPKTTLVKRVVGVPGDHLAYKNKILYINGKEMTQKPIAPAFDVEPAEGGIPTYRIPVEERQEKLNGIIHHIYIRTKGSPEPGDFDLVVPKDHYFMMGDNRDNSDDSRMWGFVPDRDLIGKATRILFSWDPLRHRIRWDRIGKSLESK